LLEIAVSAGQAGEMKSPNDDMGRYIAKIFWPELWFVPEGSFWDYYGIDAYLESDSVQIKHDRRIAKSENLWHEIYEKSANAPWQPWRKSPGVATTYIFTTETTLEFIGIKVAVDSLAIAEEGRKLVAIKPNEGDLTSMGFIIPLAEIKTEIHKMLRSAVKRPQRAKAALIAKAIGK